MTQEEAIAIARKFAESKNIVLGPVVNALHDPTLELCLLLEKRGIDPKTREKWTILFERINSTMDPGTIDISVYTATGNAKFDENL